MSNSNLVAEYEADQGQHEENCIVHTLNQHEKDIDVDGAGHKAVASNDFEESENTDKPNPFIISSSGQPDEPQVNDEKVSRKKDNTGVRWVDWEGVAEISEKKGKDSQDNCFLEATHYNCLSFEQSKVQTVSIRFLS